MNSCLYEGTVRHRRRHEVSDEFRHRLFMLCLDLDELPGALDRHPLWSARRPALAWFRRADYLGDRDLPLAGCVRDLVKSSTGRRPQGPVRLLTHIRCFGHCFNPVSFYYCYEPTGEHVEAVVAHVTNTPWGESHPYVLPVGAPADHGSASVISGHFEKELHVSPLMGMDHVYEWRLTEPGERLAVHIESRDRAGESIFDATLSLARRELDRRAMGRALARYPLLTVRIIAAIYAHALRLRLRGASYHPHPNTGTAPS